MFLSKVCQAIEPLAFHRVIALLRTDRNREQKLVLGPFVGFLDLLLEVSVSSELFILSCSAFCIFSPNVKLLCCHNLLAMRFLKCSFLRTGRAGVSLMGFTFLDNASRLPFSFPSSILYQVPHENFRCVPPKRSIPILQLSVE